MKKMLGFLFGYGRMRLGVTFGYRRTSYPLGIMWWWNHQGLLNLDNVYID